jgi:hypothetical protein
VLTLGFILTGCDRQQIRVYQAPKDEAEPRVAANDAHTHVAEAQAPSTPQLTWKLPAGWTEANTGDFSLKGFNIFGPGGQRAQVSITRLNNMSGRDALLVNMWRNSVGLDQATDEDAIKQLQPLAFGSEQGSFFEVAGKMKDQDGHEQPIRILTAYIHRPDGSWFCKLAGDPELAAAQKGAFIDFLKSLRIEESPATGTASVAAKFNWKVPDGWKEVAPGEMQVARFVVSTTQGAKAEVFVSSFGTDTGGRLANVNRWRRQINLGPVQESELAQLVSLVEPGNPDAIVVDMTNNNTNLVGAIVPRDGQYWFYKLLGDRAAVAPAKDSFIAFVKSRP